MFQQPPDSPYLVPFDGSYRVVSAPTGMPPDAPDKKHREERLDELVGRLDELQQRLYADNRHALLLVFQAMDAAGKDGTIRALLRGVNPAGCQVASFKRPSEEELDHDFLWRTARRLPERGRIGVFNRSYYEEVLVVRVHPDFLAAQRLPESTPTNAFWNARYDSLREHEAHLARNGTVILKFWLNVSAEEQRKRFLARLDDPERHWKFSEGDVRERDHWHAYMLAYERALAETSRPWAPWYAIPADSKSFARMTVAEIVVATLERLDPRYPQVDDATSARFAAMRALLDSES